MYNSFSFCDFSEDEPELDNPALRKSCECSECWNGSKKTKLMFLNSKISKQYIKNNNHKEKFLKNKVKFSFAKEMFMKLEEPTAALPQNPACIGLN
jgi:hypothetical protein